MKEGYILLVTDRLDRGDAVREALGVAVDVRVTGPDFRGQDLANLLSGRIDGVVTDISFKRHASVQALNKLLRTSGIKTAPMMCMLRQTTGNEGEQNFLHAKSVGADMCLAASTPPRKLAQAVVQTTHPNESLVDRIVNRGLSKSGDSVGALLKVVDSGGTIDQETVDGGVDPVIEAIRTGGLARWLDSVWVHDDTTYQHSLQVAGLAAAVAMALRFNPNDQKRFTRAALMHDLGKGRIPLQILNKPGRLDDDEMQVMRTHAAIGHRILVEGGITDKLTLDAALHHHEMLDGSGYPHRLHGDGISDPVRLMTICDIYAALVEKRPYKEAKTPEESFRILYGMGSKLERSMIDALALAVLKPELRAAA
jgi:putative nucleotidyltransferase with HDIG domain